MAARVDRPRRAGEDYTARGYTPGSGAVGYLNLPPLGMPFDTQPRARTIGTGPACRAIVATRLIDPAGELPVFRALQLARFTTTTMFDTEAVIRGRARARTAARPRCGRWPRSTTRDEAAYQADRALVAHRRRQPDGVPGQGGQHGRHGPLHRALARSSSTATGARLEAGGYQPVEAYDVVIANLDPTLARRAPGDDVAEILAAFPYALTTREVAAVMAAHLVEPDDRAAEEQLIDAAADGAVPRETIGGGALWHLQ